ncbi:hypothetical protein [Georgenia deserti]|uniref:DUF1656 domain-containing protein n=1 Tax=Georgenia deserti TaxID=2093781 RepID=A0ABW4L7K4_9MICO
MQSAPRDYSNDWFVAPLVLAAPVVLIGASVVVAGWRHRRGRWSFYWPLIGVVATYAFYGVLFLVVRALT